MLGCPFVLCQKGFTSDESSEKERISGSTCLSLYVALNLVREVINAWCSPDSVVISNERALVQSSFFHSLSPVLFVQVFNAQAKLVRDFITCSPLRKFYSISLKHYLNT